MRDFIVDFVERLKQYAVDYAVDQDRTEILALESAREKEQSGRQTAHSLRKGNEIDLSNREYALFREKIAEIKIGKSAQFPKSAKGEYILAIDNKLVYTDGDYIDARISQIIELNVGDETDTDLARWIVFDCEKKGADLDEIQRIVEGCFGKGSITVDIPGNEQGNGRQNGRGKSGNLQKVRKDDHGDLSSAETRKYALKKNVEQIEDLVAVHNTAADKLKKTLDLGGFPMPSIAVTCCEKCFSEWRGDICRRKKSDNIARVLGIQFPDKTSNDRSSADIIADLTRAVNGENSENHAENAQDTANGDKTQAETPEHEINHEGDEMVQPEKNCETNITIRRG